MAYDYERTASAPYNYERTARLTPEDAEMEDGMPIVPKGFQTFTEHMSEAAAQAAAAKNPKATKILKYTTGSSRLRFLVIGPYERRRG